MKEKTNGDESLTQAELDELQRILEDVAVSFNSSSSSISSFSSSVREGKKDDEEKKYQHIFECAHIISSAADSEHRRACFLSSVSHSQKQTSSIIADKIMKSLRRETIVDTFTSLLSNGS